MDESSLIRAAEEYMERKMATYDPSHDHLHVYRVRATAMKLARTLPSIDLTVVNLAALFHDINDHKYVESENDNSIEEMKQLMRNREFAENRLELVLKIAENTSYSTEKRLRANKEWTEWHESCKELHCVQDADRLDAIGAIGVLRAAAFSSAKNKPLYDRYSKDSCYQHFFDKLLLLKDALKTDLGREEGQRRHAIMLKVTQELRREMDMLR